MVYDHRVTHIVFINENNYKLAATAVLNNNCFPFGNLYNTSKDSLGYGMTRVNTSNRYVTGHSLTPPLNSKIVKCPNIRSANPLICCKIAKYPISESIIFIRMVLYPGCCGDGLFSLSKRTPLLNGLGFKRYTSYYSCSLA